MEVINIIPIDRKYTLSVEEASALTGIGTKKLYSMITADKGADYLLHVGRRTLIKREAFMSYLNQVNDI